MNRHVISLFLVLALFSDFAYNQNIDSLKVAFSSQEGSEKAKTAHLYALAVLYENPNKTIEIATFGIEGADKQRDKELLGKLYDDIGIANGMMGNYAEAYKNFNMSLNIFTEMEDKKLMAVELNNIGLVYFAWGNYDKSLEAQLKCLKLKEDLGDSSSLAFPLNNIGMIYGQMKEYEKALSYFNRVKKIAIAEKDSVLLGMSLMNIGKLYTLKEDQQKSKKYYEEAYDILKDKNVPQSIGKISLALGIIYLEEGKNEKAFEFYYESLKLSRKVNDISNIASCHEALAHAFLEEDNIDSALFHAKTGLEIYEKIEAKDKISSSYEMLSIIYEEKNDIDKALEFFKKHHELNNEIYSEENANRIAEMQVKYETEKKEKEIELLNLKQRLLMLFSGIIILFILIMVLLIYNRLRIKKKLTLKLEKQNNELELANATKDKFFAIIAHDLKNHLLAFLTLAEILEEKHDSLGQEKLKVLTSKINRSSHILYNLFENLLKWSTSQIGSMPFQPEQLKTYEVAGIAQEANQLLADKKNIILDIDIPENHRIYADKQMLLTIFRNLVNNAIKFSGSGTTVNVCAKSQENGTLISVKDKGTGLSEDDIEKLFKLDIPNNKIGSSSEKGSGLGLFICKEFVDKHNGTISIASGSGKGFTIEILLPGNKN